MDPVSRARRIFFSRDSVRISAAGALKKWSAKVFPRLRRRAKVRTRRISVELLEDRSLLAALPPDGLVSWYRAEGDAKDFEGANNGALVGGATFATGEVGQAISLNGTDAYVSVPDSPSLSLISGATYTAWIKLNQLPSDAGHFMEIAAKSQSGNDLDFQVETDNHVRFYVGAGVRVSSTTALQTGQWYFVAATYSANNQIAIYVNGSQEAAATINVTHTPNSNPLIIGANAVFPGHFFNGSIDEVQVYNRQLSAGEVQSIYNAGSEGLATIVVNTSSDAVDPNDGVTSLREAINQSNASVGSRNVIGFNIPTQPLGEIAHYAAEKSANDSVGTNNGTLQGTANYATTGVSGDAFSFDGSGYVRVPDSSSLQLADAPFSVSLWFNTSTLASDQILFSKGVSDANEEYTVSLGADGGIYWDYGGGQAYVFSPTSVVANQWYQLTVTYDPTTSPRGAIYLNGVGQAITSSSTGPHIVNSGSDLFIGTQNAGTPYYVGRTSFHGLIDEFGIYKRGLSASEITNLYQAGKALMAPVTVPPPIDWYRAEGNANDSVGGNNGTLQGGATFAPGQVGKAFSFDGVNDTVDLGDVASLDTPGNFTFAAWINQSSAGTIPLIVSDYDANGNTTQGSLDVEGGHLFWYQVTSTESKNYSGVTSLSLNQWYHVAVVRNDAAKTVTLYVNGVQDGASHSYTGTVVGLQGHKYLGSGGPNFPNDFFQGRIDEAQIFNVALSGPQIQAVYAAGASAPQISGEVSHYAAEKTANDTLGTNNGTLQGSVPFAPGVIGSAFSFDGNPANYVSIPPNPSLDLTQFTVDAWIYPTENTTGFVLDKEGSNGANFILSFSNGSAEIDYQPGNHQFVDAPVGLIPLNTWTHIAGTYDGPTSKQLKLYVNGVLVGTHTAEPGMETPPVGQPTYIGVRNNGAFPFHGLIDETQVFSRALTASEVNSIYQSGQESLSLQTHAPIPDSWYRAEGDFKDSADGNDGVSQGGVKFVSGQVGSAFDFSGNGDRITVPNNSNIDFTTARDYSIDAWMKSGPQAGVVAPTLIEKWDGSGGYPYVVRVDSATGHAYAAAFDGTNNPVAVSSTRVDDNQWHDVAAVFRHSLKRIDIYVDGKLDGSTTYASLGTIANGSTLWLGGGQLDPQKEYNGLLDEVHIFGTPLSADQVQAMYAAGASGNVPQFSQPQGPVSLFRGEGNANDSADGNNGTLQHGAAFAPGVIGQAFDLTAPGSYVQVPDSENLRLGAGEITLDAWIKADAGHDYRTIMAKPDSVLPYEDYELRITPTNTAEFFATSCATAGGGCGGFVPVPSTSIVADGTFHHVAGVRRANGDQEIYVDGVLENTINRPVQNTDSSAAFTIGYPGLDFRGLVDEAQVYNVALTAAEIRAQVAAARVQQTLVRTIAPTSALPPINDTVIIDGYTQPGSSANTLVVGNDAKLLIELNGKNGSGSAFAVNAPNNTFRGLVINSFPGAPFDVGYAFRLFSAGNTIQGSYLGIDPTGNTAEPNRGGGISVQATSQPPTPSGNNLIGGATAAARNVIGGGLQDFAININGLDAAVFQGGIIGGDGNTVQGNYIGTNAAGSAILGKAGINIFTKNNIIGGTTPEARNVLFSFGGLGLNLSESNASGNIIQGNYIGINATGDAALGSTTAGITLLRAPNNTIGGTAPGAGNVISGNSFGINAAESDNLTIQGNLIGTNAAGTAAIGNSSDLAINGGNNLKIGGTAAGAGNVISGSTSGHGIALTIYTATTGDLIQGNYIGTDITGTVPLKNAAYGIQVGGETPTAPFVIGGTTAAARNVISGNGLDGLSLQTSNVFVQGNFIGTDVTGTNDLGNGANGINIFGSNDAVGAATGGANRIAFNHSAGVFVNGSTGNVILGNSIFSNTGLGIDLSFSGVTANDVTPPADSDTGANNLQNFPVIAAAVLTGAQLSLTYSVPSDVSNSAYPLRVEFYKADADAQEGQTFLGSVVYTDAQAGTAASPSFIPAVPLAVGDKIVATATDTDGNTSEFSAAATVQSCLTVVNTNDSGLGSLRQAIICANAAAGADTISFNIPGSGVHTISPTTALPNITDPIVIDGYTQPGAAANTNGSGLGDNAVLLVELNGSSAQSANGLQISGGNSTVRGLVINHFGDGIAIQTNGGNTIEGNFIGTDTSGLLARANFIGVGLESGNNQVGGTTPAARNVISGNSNNGIALDTATTSNTIQGNFIGTTASGTAALANGNGIFVGGTNNTVGGTTAAARNVISGNSFDGVTLSFVGVDNTSGNVVQGNYIGVDVTGVTAVPNSSGVRVFASGNTIGGSAAGAGNVIAFNHGDGIEIDADRTSVTSNTIFSNGARGIAVVTGIGNSILKNSIFSNVDLGIDLFGPSQDALGVTPNDAGDADTGPNNLQNFPVISLAVPAAGQLSLTYAVPSAPANSQYPIRVEFFKADAGGTQGQTYLGFDTFTQADFVVGAKTFLFTPAVSVAAGEKIVATATDNAGNTSEFSAAAALPSCTTVINTDDSGPGSLRQAIICANATPGTDTISFNIPGSGVHTISPLTALPLITDSVIIDGYTQPGASPNTLATRDNAKLLIELSGVNVTSADAALVLQVSNSTIRGLVINEFPNDALWVEADGNVVQGNFLGTSADGMVAKPNGRRGASLLTASNTTFGGTSPSSRNIIFAENNDGLIDASGTDNAILGNFIGVDASGSAPFIDATTYGCGVRTSDATGTLIGGSLLGAGNVISGNDTGICIWSASSGVIVQGNLVGTDSGGTLNVHNRYRGVWVDDVSTNSMIGGTTPGAGNLIAFSGDAGVSVVIGGGNAVLGNTIFGNVGLGIDLGGDGSTPNDATDADTGANNLQNFPVISYATRDVGKLKVTYNVPSDSANSTYPIRVEFFLADASGQGKTYLGFDTFTATGNKTITFATAAATKVFDKIVATATDSLTAAAGGGPANTSEFSPAVAIVSPWQNRNAGRLRWDVNDDTFVSADDVLAIINYINAKGSGLIPDTAANQKPYCDVDGDNNVVAADVIDIINYINAGRRLGGEAEAPTELSSGQNQGLGDVMSILAADVAAESIRKRRG
jgi:parallel beta-helix repeat protein